ncbi:glycine/D-amino acid oxidase-like deaminating enzyme [Sinobacterium caligoides]|uniref:Glycine/D-amino acid oxidase-like deaminating enzyme n=1 Tax=Sinobacterium caligoides TaxID=933926 RepID=A0A3N2E0T2_9GAMM|nr:FAD-dependent oxidoreductase [Sinobacterium caligoides]ROS05512.1 glycine/D-amino acid oxidase-like deaminating enzyme [Sinobacterium caligoides]
MTKRIAVVGAGAVGKAITYQFLTEGYNCTLFDPQGGASHSASRVAGGMQGSYSEITEDNQDSKQIKFCLDSHKVFRSWLKQIENDSGIEVYLHQGSIVFANSIGGIGDKEAINVMIKKIQEQGDTYENLMPSDIPFMKPSSHCEVEKAIYIPSEAGFDAETLHESLFGAIKAYPKANVVADSVTDITPVTKGECWAVTTTNGETHEFDSVIISAGAQAEKLLGESLYSELALPPMYGGKGVALLMENTLDINTVIRTPNRHGACGTHAVPRKNGLYVGATNRPSLDPTNNGGATAGEINFLFDGIINQINNQFANSALLGTLAAYRPFTADGKPFIGQTNQPGLFLATGTGRTGILMAPLIAQIIVDEVMGKTPRQENVFTPIDRKGSYETIKTATFEQLYTVAKAAVIDVAGAYGSLPLDSSNTIAAYIAQMLHELVISYANGNKVDGKIMYIFDNFPTEVAVPLLYSTVVSKQLQKL